MIVNPVDTLIMQLPVIESSDTQYYYFEIEFNIDLISDLITHNLVLYKREKDE